MTEFRDPDPSVVIIDSQSVKTGKAGGYRGFDGGKRVKGRKRHLVVDALGLMVDVLVTPANTHDTFGARSILTKIRYRSGISPSLVYADGGYGGRPFAQWLRDELDAEIEISANLAKRPSGSFQPKSGGSLSVHSRGLGTIGGWTKTMSD